MQKSFVSLYACLMLICNFSAAQSVIKTPLPADHPLVGSWKINVPNTNCDEIYQIRTDGTTYVTSNEEIAESEFQISLHPDSMGFYKWVDKIVKDNGKPDCTRQNGVIGDVSVNFIKLNSTGTRFMMCTMEDSNTCIGPFIRQEGV